MKFYQTFQDPCTPVIEAIVEVHSYIIFFLFAIVTSSDFVIFFLDLILLLVLFNNTADSNGGPSPDVGPGGDGNSPSPDDDDENWKKKWIVLGVVVGVLTVVSAGIGIAGKLGWDDWFAAWNRPREFFGAAADHATSFTGTKQALHFHRDYLLSIFSETWSQAADPKVIAAKLEIARIPPQILPEFQRKLMELGTSPNLFATTVLQAYPEGACNWTLQTAIKIAVEDKIDTLILEYATGGFW